MKRELFLRGILVKTAAEVFLQKAFCKAKNCGSIYVDEVIS